MSGNDRLARREQEREEALAVLAEEVKRLQQELLSRTGNYDVPVAVQKAMQVAAQSPVWREWP